MNHSRPLLLRLDSKILQPRFKEARDLLMARDGRVHITIQQDMSIFDKKSGKKRKGALWEDLGCGRKG